MPTTLTVDGRLLTGSYSAAEERGGRLYVPVVGIAQALGDTARVFPAEQRVEVRRSTGVLADFDATLGQVRENGVPTLLATSAGEVVFSPDPRALLLPVEIVSALLNANIVVDSAQRTVRVTRDLPQVRVSEGAARGVAQLHALDYGYNLSAGDRSFAHNLQMSASGRAHDGRFGLNGNFTGGTQAEFMNFRYGLLTYDRPSGQRLMAGDLSTSSELTFLNTATRGGWWRQPLGATDLTTFAGRVRSGERPPVAELPAIPGVAEDARFDTSLVGSYLTLGREHIPGSGPGLMGSAGGMYFRGPGHQGGLLSSGMQYTTALHQFRADLGWGSFEGRRTDGREVRGTALLVDTLESLTPVESLTLSAGFTHIGENFLAPQLEGTLRSMNLLSSGVNWQPHRVLQLSSTARYLERLDLAGHPTERDITAGLALRPGARWPSLRISHSQGTRAETGKLLFTLMNLTGYAGDTELFSNLSRSVVGETAPTLALTVGAQRSFATSTLRLYQSVASGRTFSGGADFVMPAFLTKRVSVQAGVGYGHSNGQFTTNARVGLAARLPAQQLLQLNYTQSMSGGSVFLELKGPLYAAPGVERSAQRNAAPLRTLGSFSGRVYQDVNLNGRFDAAVDKPLANVELLVNGSTSVRTNGAGEYLVPSLTPGEHALELNLLSVRADLSMLTGAKQSVLLLPERDAVIDFRLVRTGRVRGTVWLDRNQNGELEDDEELLGDVRVVAGTRDTLTSTGGEFILGDLPQGRHTLMVDEKTLPEGMKAAAGGVPVEVEPPAETSDVRLPVHEKPVEVEIQEFPAG